MCLKMTLKVLEDERITVPLEIVAMIALADWADEDGVVWRNPKMRRIAKRLRRSKRTAQRVIEKLIAKDFVARVSVGGGTETNIFQLYPLELGINTHDIDDTGDNIVSRESRQQDVTGAMTPAVTATTTLPTTTTTELISDDDVWTHPHVEAACRLLFGTGNLAARKSLSKKRKESVLDMVRQLNEQEADLSLLPRYMEWWKQDWRSSWDRVKRECNTSIFQMPTALNVLDTWGEFTLWLEMKEGADPNQPMQEPQPTARYIVRRSFEDGTNA